MSSPVPEPRARWLAAVLFLILLPLSLLWPSIVAGKHLAPFDLRCFPPGSLVLDEAERARLDRNANFDITETTLLHAQEVGLARAELARGRFPAFNPYARLGAPLFANAISGLAHPLHLHHLWHGCEPALVWTAWLAWALAGLLMLGLLRELGCGSLAATFGAVAFCCSGTMLARLHVYTHHGTLLWLPAMLWALTCLARTGSARAVAALALATALCWTAVFPPAALACSLVAGLWYLVLALRSARFALRGALGFLLGLSLAAFQLLPMIGYYPESQHDLAPDLTKWVQRSLDPACWLDLVLEAPFTTPQHNRAGGVPYHRVPLFWLLHSRAGEHGVVPFFKFTEQKLHVGALPLLLALAGFGRGRWRFGAFALIAAAAAAWLASGGIAYRALARALPPVAALQPMELASPIACLLAAAAGLGCQRWLELAGSRGTTLLAILACAIAALAACGWAVLEVLDAQSVAKPFHAAIEARWGEVAAQVSRGERRAFFADALTPAEVVLQESLARAAIAFAVAGLLLATLRHATRTVALVALLVTAAELVHASSRSVRHQEPLPGGGEPVVGFLAAARDDRARQGGFAVLRVAPGSRPTLPTALPPDLLFPLRVRDLNAYACVDARSHLPFRALYPDLPDLFLRDYWLGAFPDDERLERPWFDLLGARYALGFVPAGSDPPRHAGVQATSVAGSHGQLVVCERATPCPRAFVVPAPS